ncbi:FAD-binding oxidoreductase [Pseudactinotalea sp. HY158]|uniref:NAD(P)/FAD-dependent oxidoreductase n=1 Tax=Pseudactinotalea sp. HY158 TaxID=2654547 RepID=UPI00129CB09E|nr:FAD-dependent oxidoreductase [Pseudactinotalea sp. HY158]QGH68718.1 FAD-dependent oxidoreductase [Pseudactinotalea sp. HY158]
MATPRSVPPLPPARSAIVIGAGIVGLCTALHLRRLGLEVTVLEADGVAAGSSWGNAGWLTPDIATPLPEPSVLAGGVRALVSPSAPLYVPLRADPRLVRFLTGFLRHCTPSRWRRGMAALMPVNERALDAYAELATLGVAEPTRAGDPFIAAFARAGQERDLLAEFAQIRSMGLAVEVETISGRAARELAPALSPRIATAVILHGTRFLHPPNYLAALGEACVRAGVEVRTGATVSALDGGTPTRGVDVRWHPTPAGGRRRARAGESHRADLAVVAAGVHSGALLRPHGVRRLVQAGRGYSFTVPVDPMPTMPLYFHAARVACTPLGDRYRIAGMMEFRRPGDPLDPRRIDAIVSATEPLLAGADFTDRRHEWVGSRPCTTDGLPLVGPTRSPRVIAATGHGMWGMTQGPITGALIAAYVRTRRLPDLLRPFDPLR